MARMATGRARLIELGIPRCVKAIDGVFARSAGGEARSRRCCQREQRCADTKRTHRVGIGRLCDEKQRPKSAVEKEETMSSILPALAQPRADTNIGALHAQRATIQRCWPSANIQGLGS